MNWSLTEAERQSLKSGTPKEPLAVLLHGGGPVQQQLPQLLWVCDGQRTPEVLADVGRGGATLLAHGHQGGEPLAQEALWISINEHQNLKEHKGTAG